MPAVVRILQPRDHWLPGPHPPRQFLLGQPGLRAGVIDHAGNDGMQPLLLDHLPQFGVSADHVIDTSGMDAPTLQQQIRERFGSEDASPHLQIQSFGFARGLPRNADLVFDMRFLRNPHWVPALKPAR